jgi:8-oxo-dGTP pyrophosphatase MutT (NUDIX family)
LEAGETFEEAALREADEELGVKGRPVKLLWERKTDFVYVDVPVRQYECFFLLEAEIHHLSPDVQKTHEREGIVEMRWWTTSAIASTREPVFPEDIVSELQKISN